MIRTAMILLMTVASTVLVGCGGEATIAGDTPEATANAFVEAMKAKEYDKVAAGFDYETYARQQNPDWDTFGESQRNLIVDKLQEDKAEEIEALAGMFAGGEATISNVKQKDDEAGATINAGANKLVLHLIHTDGKWLILKVYEGTQG